MAQSPLDHYKERLAFLKDRITKDRKEADRIKKIIAALLNGEMDISKIKYGK